MNFKDLALLLCEMEEGKEQINVAQMRSVLSNLSLIMKHGPLDLLMVLNAILLSDTDGCYKTKRKKRKAKK